MSEWKEYELQEVVSIIKDVYTPSKGDNKRYIGLEHIHQHSLRLDSIGTSESVTSQKFSFRSSDILFGKLRPYFRKVVNPDFDGVCSTDIWVIRAKENHNQKFVRYLLSTYEFIETCNIGESGTRMPRADWNHLKGTKWLLPEYDEQERIAEVLSSLDDKIDLLHCQNQTLEQLAETMFRQCFGETQEEKALNFFGRIICGKTPSKEIPEYFNGSIPFIKIPDMHSNVFIMKTQDTLSDKGVSSQKNKTIPPGSICVSCIATVGLVSITTETSHTNQQINTIVPNVESFTYFLFNYFRSIKDELLMRASGGSVTHNLNTSDFSKIPVPFYDDKKYLKYHKEVKPLYDKIYLNCLQIKKLEKTRDTLLPKLMSGAVRVK